MSDLQTLYAEIDRLKPHDLIRLQAYIEERAQSVVYLLSSDHLKAIDEAVRPIQDEAANMTEEEINAAIDEAIAEVRHERKSARGN